MWLCKEANDTYAICKYKPKLPDILTRTSYPFALVRSLCPKLAKEWFRLKKPLERNTCVKVYYDIEVLR